MKKSFVTLCTGAIAFVAFAGSALGFANPGTTVQKCADQMQLNVIKYVNSVQKQVRLSIKNNLNAKDSKCADKSLVCVGGTANVGKACTDNSTCTGGQCNVNTGKGIAGAINKAKGGMRAKFAQFCTMGDLTTLGFPGSRCPSTADTVDEVADCVLQGAIGDFAAGVFGDPAGEIMARATGKFAIDTPNPVSVCGVTLGSILQIGSASTSNTPAEAGGAQPVVMDGCVGAVCQTKGIGVIGNNLTAPTQTFAGAIPVCLVTVTGNAGNGTNQDGSIDLSTGEQHSFAPIESTVLIGTTCPVCSGGVCNSGTNLNNPCSNEGATDVACPPTVAGSPPVIPNPLDLDTENNTLSVPANNPGGGANNPAGTFCGACDLDNTVGCQNDSGCVAAFACSGGVGSGCCQFGTNTGAFGVPSATSISANGKRGPYVPIIATAFCTGQSGDGTVDSTQGLPGPVRLVQEQLNAFKYTAP